MVLFYLAWPKAEHLPTMHKRSWRNLDCLGSFLLIAAAVLVVFAFQNAGEDKAGNPWAKGIFIGPLVAGLTSSIVLFVWEGIFEYRWRHKMAAVPLILIRNRVFAAATLNTIFLGFAYLATLYAVPLRLQVVNGKSPIMTGVMMLPMLGGTGVGSALTGALSKNRNRLFETMMVATVMVTLGLALETTVSDTAELEPKFLGFEVFIGLGYGMITSSATISTVVEAPITEHGKSTSRPPYQVRARREKGLTGHFILPAPAQGIIAQSRMLGGSIGIAMSSAVLAVQQRSQLVGIVSPSMLSGLQKSGYSLTPEQYAAIRKTYNDSFTETMKVCAIIAGVGVLLTMGTYRRDRVSLKAQREQQVSNEIGRRRAEKEAVNAASQSSG